jgi:peptidoglycan-N-acetylglucosamine deacetylase
MTMTILCGVGVDVDAVAGWPGSHGGEDSADPIRRRGRLTATREALRQARIKVTRFIPGRSIETFPSQMQVVADAGHEIGISAPAARAKAMNEGVRS